MRFLVVFANPDPASFGAAILQAAVTGLERGGHDVDVIDLDRSGYEPCLSAEELRGYDTLAAAHPDAEVATHIDLLRNAEGLVFVYPTFWGGMPAIMKGWVDRTLLPGVAFAFDPDSRRIRGRLTHLRHLIGITTYGSPRSYRWLVGDAGRRLVRRVIRFSCGARCRSRWLSLDGLDGRQQSDRADFLREVELTMAEL